VSRYLPEPQRPDPAPDGASDHASLGILLVNLGSPEAPTPRAVKAYLKQFLSDLRVVEMSPFLWQPILRGVVLNTRPKASAAKYASVWTRDGAPLLYHTAEQARLLKGYLGQRGISAHVGWAMRYGKPDIAHVLTQLKHLQPSHLLIVPLYPQYAASTTASAMDSVYEWFSRTRNQPRLRVVRDFHDYPRYIGALEDNVRQSWRVNGQPDADTQLVMSFHGLPRRSLELGDPYFHECQRTGTLLAQRLNLKPEQYRITFQSRFGRREWLQPYTSATLETLAREGVRRVDVICPGFVADCLETLEEIAMLGKQQFLSAGGKVFNYIPALNENESWIHTLADLVESYLDGWPVS
jgi:ferrochelatase